MQAGHRVDLLDTTKIGVDAQGRFTDLQDRVIERWFKLYPWEFMLREPFTQQLIPSGDIFVEPAWKVVLSNKGLLPLLWQRHRGHPNLIAAYFSDDARAGDLREFVRKPLLSRECENVTITRNGEVFAKAEGEYGEEGFVIQEYAPLFASEGGYAVLGSWIVGDRACGLAVREDRSPITANLSRFIPHYVLD